MTTPVITCRGEDCERAAKTRGYCQMHYRRLLKYGDASVVKKVARNLNPICKVEGCERATRSRGWCNLHWRRWKDHGDVQADLPPRDELSIVDRFMKHVDKVESGCWEWTAGLTRGPNGDDGGYGKFKAENDRTAVAHRWYYERTVRELPDYLHLDHLCRNRKCVNPDHLEPVTCRENLMRGEGFAAVNAQKTHCINGHPFSAENTRHYTWKGAPHRACRECAKRRKRDRRRATRIDEGIAS